MAFAQQTSSDVLQDYIYGYAPVAMSATMALQTAVPNAMGSPGRAPVNQFAYGGALASPGSQVIVRPDPDTIYANACLDLSSQPLILHVPNTGGRFYLMALFDAYSNQFVSVGSRATGNGEGNVLIVGPDWSGSYGSLHESFAGVIYAPTNAVWLIGRTFINGRRTWLPQSPFRNSTNLTPLSAFQDFLNTGSYIAPSGVPVTSPNPDFAARPITSSRGFSNPEFFNVLIGYALQNPPPLDRVLQATSLVYDGFVNQNQLTPAIVSQANASMLSELRSSGTVINGLCLSQT
jgi:hypothetical protein